MLVLTRRDGEKIRVKIGDEVIWITLTDIQWITVVDIRFGRVQLGFAGYESFEEDGHHD